jgi:hypothetical protein
MNGLALIRAIDWRTVLVEVVERLGRPRWLDAGPGLDLALELVVGEGEHPAVGVVDKDDLLGLEQPLRDRERVAGLIWAMARISEELEPGGRLKPGLVV